jgi:hypothetical protein
MKDVHRFHSSVEAEILCVICNKYVKLAQDREVGFVRLSRFVYEITTVKYILVKICPSTIILIRVGRILN